MDSIYMMLQCILNKADPEGIFRYAGIIDVPVEYLAGHNLDGKESEQRIPVDVVATANNENIIIRYDVNLGPIVFREIRNEVSNIYNKLFDERKTETDIDIDEFQTILIKRVEDELGDKLTKYNKVYNVDREFLVDAVRKGVTRLDLGPIADINYRFDNQYKQNEFKMIQIEDDDAVMFYILSTIIEGEQVIKGMTVHESIADFEADKQAS